MLYILLMIKVFKMYKLLNNDNTKSKITAIFSKCEILDNNKSTIIIVFLTICCLNMTTCLYIFIGKNNFPNWILKLDLQDESYINIYLASLYFSIMTTTTVGYGDITGDTLLKLYSKYICL